MKTNLVKIFPTTVSITEDFLTDEEVKILLNMVRDINSQSHELILGDGVSSNTNKFYEKDDFLKGIEKTHLYYKITQQLNEYTSAMGLFEVFLDNSWFNIQRPSSTLDAHHHSGSKVSGALYLKVDEKSSSLILHDVHPFHNYREHTTSNEYNGIRCSIKPKIGMLVLFPSWLTHSGDINHSDERIVISFNADNKTMPL